MSYNPRTLMPDGTFQDDTDGSSLPLPSHCPATLIQLSQNMVEGMFVAGGSCITILNANHQYGDFDIYVNNKGARNHAISVLQGYGFEKTGTSDSFLTEWSDGLNKAQIIMAEEVKTIEDLLGTFDLNVCRIGFDKDGVTWTLKCHLDITKNRVTLSDRAYNDYHTTLFRMFKYASKGYTISKELSAEFIDALSHKLTNQPVLTREEIERRVTESLGKTKTVTGSSTFYNVTYGAASNYGPLTTVTGVLK